MYWDSIVIWVERSVVNWVFMLWLGQGWIDGIFFDSVSFIGGRLVIDVCMLLGFCCGFVLLVSGVVCINVCVMVIQNGVLLYEVMVLLGKFIFDDFYFINVGGDLQVMIYEVDGSQDIFIVLYVMLSGLVQVGVVYYDLLLGYLDEDGIVGWLGFGEVMLQYGFNDYISGYIGVNVMIDYYLMLVGSVFNIYWGVLVVDFFCFVVKGREYGWQEGYCWWVFVLKLFIFDM